MLLPTAILIYLVYSKYARQRRNALACEVAFLPLISRRSRKPLALDLVIESGGLVAQVFDTQLGGS